MNVVRIISIKTSSNWSPKLDSNEYWSFSWLTQSLLIMECNSKGLISHRDRKGNSEKIYGILSCYDVCAVFSISSSVLFQQQTVADTANGVTDLASAANAWVAILPSMANVNVSLAFYMVVCFNFVCYWYRLKVIAWSGFTHQVQHL